MSNKHQFPHSTSISEIEYHPDIKALDITFASGGRHRHHDVPQDEVDSFKAANSPGNYYHLNIRKVYKSSRLD